MSEIHSIEKIKRNAIQLACFAEAGETVSNPYPDHSEARAIWDAAFDKALSKLEETGMRSMTLAQLTPDSSPFAVLSRRQPSTILCKMGRIKTERQTLLDAKRVNAERHDCAAWVPMSKKTAI